MIKVLFVCHGNICRSPIAEFVMKDLVRKEGLSDCFEIASAVTSSEEIWNGVGNPVYPPARRILAQHGLSCSGKRARQITKADYQRYDYLIGMDQMNYRNMLRVFGKDTEGKVSLLMDYTDRPGNVADPWYTDDFETTWTDVMEGCRGLLAWLKQNKL
ncbi:MAG: low molecular weight phosphotyrosine protein phosphatase [Blautia sp.]|nr:low molecular weight phosphotyrosine protein phosphatase [Blautia sp.]